MSEKYKHVSKRQRAIMSFLTTYGEMSTRAIIDHLYPDEKVKYGSTKYSSILRTLGAMWDKGMITKVVGQTMWRKSK